MSDEPDQAGFLTRIRPTAAIVLGIGALFAIAILIISFLLALLAR
jgi:hypothetical protein